MTKRRRGYILVFVLGVTTVVTALGLSYISSNGTVMQQATNRYAAVRAQYLAESGVALATHFVSYPPTTVAYNGVYTGASNVAVDGSYDVVSMSVMPSSPANRYVITARAVARNATGTEVLAKQAISSEMIIPPEPKWKITQAVLATGSITVPAGVSIAGNLHANGNVTGPLFGGSCNGSVSATGLAVWLAGGSPSPVLSLQPAVSAPPASGSLYASYKVNNTSYAAYTGFGSALLKTSDIAALNSAVNAGGTNPGRIVIAPSGDFRFQESLSFTGTFVVRGNLRMDGSTISLQSVANYPALVVTGDIYAAADGMNVTINGSVICGGKLMDDGRKNCSININGSLITDTVSRTGPGSTIIITWNSTNSTFWNLTRTANPEPVTVLDWTEN